MRRPEPVRDARSHDVRPAPGHARRHPGPAPARGFARPAPRFTTLRDAGMGLFKLGILHFNRVPYLALHLVGRVA